MKTLVWLLLAVNLTVRAETMLARTMKTFWATISCAFPGGDFSLNSLRGRVRLEPPSHRCETKSLGTQPPSFWCTMDSCDPVGAVIESSRVNPDANPDVR